jgi:hypothetical protein
MKNILFRLFLLSGLVLFTRCEEPDNAIYTVLEDYTNGAVLRTLSDPAPVLQFNRSEPDQAFFVKLEQQDEQNGDLLERVDVYAKLNSSLSDIPERVVRTLNASAFTKNANDLNEVEVSLTLNEVLSELEASASDYEGGNSITVRFDLVLTDGRNFTAGDATGSLQGSYFSSPYQYNAVIKCIPSNPVPGVYVVDMQDSYGDGWNNGKILVSIDGATPIEIDLDSAPGATGAAGRDTFTVPAGTQSLSVQYSSGNWDSEVTFQITRNDDLIFSDGPSPAAGTDMIFSICNP